MLANYIKTAFRNLFKYKGFSFINVSGLSIGMTCSFLILLWIADELSFDGFHENSSELCRVVTKIKNDNGITQSALSPTPLGPALVNEFPEVADFARYSGGRAQTSVHYDDISFNETIIWGDPNLFDVFSFAVIEGDPYQALETPSSLVITRRIAEKYFGTNKGIVGRTLKLTNQYEYRIGAVIENVPANSHLYFDIIGPYSVMRFFGFSDDNWRWSNSYTYLLLEKNVSYQELNRKIADFIERHNKGNEYTVEVFLQPLMDVHLHSDFNYDRSRLGNIMHVVVLSMIALFILLIACINYMNLSTTRSANRAKEIGIRKVVGASRKQLVLQFYGESVFLSIIALVIALILAVLLLPYFSDLSGKELSIDRLGNWQIIAIVTLTAFSTGIVAGSYPAFFLSSFQAIKVLKGTNKSGSKSVVLRKILVVVQFGLSVFLIIDTAIVYTQLQYIKNKDMGYDRQNIMIINMPYRNSPIGMSHDTLRNELSKNSKILGVAASAQNPTNMQLSYNQFSWRNKDPESQLQLYGNQVTVDFPDTLGMKVIMGRGFSSMIPSDRNFKVLINEQAKKLLGFENPIGEIITYVPLDLKAEIIGVVKDFHFQPVHRRIEPMLLGTLPIRSGYTMIKLQGDQMVETIRFISETWKMVYPSLPFNYHFLDEDYNRLYRVEQKMGVLLTHFALLVVFVAFLGLYGLVSFTTEQRTKEIGIRKVLGASTPSLVWLLCVDFLKPVLFSNLIAWPIAYYSMNNWLQNYAYRIDVDWSVFLMAALLSIAIALLTVSYKATKAALSNPVKSLRYE